MRPEDPKKFPVDAAVGDDAGGSSLAVAFPSTGSPKRRPIAPRLLVTVAIQQAWDSHLAGHTFFACPLCKKPLLASHKRVLEHMTPVALGGQNTVDNLRYVHAACAAVKTNGNGATVADGDLHKIAKAKRLDRAREAHRAVLAGEVVREPGKIKSRGFPKVHRPMRRPQP